MRTMPEGMMSWDAFLGSDPLLWAMLALEIAAITFFPGMMVAYWWLVVRYRVADIRSRLWTQAARRLYIQLFTGLKPNEGFGNVVEGTPSKEFDDILLRDFQTVHSPVRYFLSVPAVTIVLGLNVWTCFAWAQAKLTGSVATAGELELTHVMALAGAYIWSVFEVLGRYRTRDLTPEDMLEMGLRNIAALPLGQAFSMLATPGFAPALAFACAAFPLREVKLLIRERALKQIGSQGLTAKQGGDGRLSVVLNSLGDSTLARLEELHIETYMDLAYVNPTRLMARTGHSLRIVLAWIDQALLIVYAAPHVRALAGSGIPCALDAREFFHDHFADAKPEVWRRDPAVIAMADALKVPVDTIQEMFKRVHEDPHVQFLHAIWHAAEQHESAIVKVT
jgi:hypothetical protein